MTSLGFSEYAESNNNNNNEPKSNIRRGGGGGGLKNRTLKIPRNQETITSNGGSLSVSSSSANDNTVGKKIKQIKDYIENIHRKGGEDSGDESDDGASILPSYPAQGMGVYATNVSHSGIIRGADTVSSKTTPPQVVRKTTQMNSLNPSSSYSSTLLEGMESTGSIGSGIGSGIGASPYFEKVMGTSGSPKNDRVGAASASATQQPFSTNPKTSTYATQYYEQFVPYAESLANQLSSESSGNMSGTNTALIEKLNYIIHMLEEKKDEKTGHVIEELVLYCFLGIFIIFIVDTFMNAAAGSGGSSYGRGMFGGRRAATLQYRR
jgi:hypothetical protein